MAKSREIVKHLKSVHNIRKITKTMEMIATARFQKAFVLARNSRPYAEHLQSLLHSLVQSAGSIDHPLLRQNPHSDCAVILVLTANRGLCGGYNSQILRYALYQLLSFDRQHLQIELRVVGKRGIRFFRFIHRRVDQEYTQFGDKTNYRAVEALANEYMEMYQQSRINSVRVVSMQFQSMTAYKPQITQLLPVVPLEAAPARPLLRGAVRENYEFSPSAPELLAEVIPMSVRTALYRCFTDAWVTENIARRKAMQAATDSAEKMTRDLNRRYNRARQSQITTELMDIIGGAEAFA